MSGFFSTKSPLWRALTKIADLIWLNILFVICCIPIFTIGAALSAMYSVTFKMAINEEGAISQDFFNAFRENFKKATVLWLIMLGIGIFLIADLFMVAYLPSSLQEIALVVLGIIGVLFIITLSYLFPLQSKFENPPKRTLMNALLLSIRHLLPTTIVVALLTSIPGLIVYFAPHLLVVFLPVVVLILFSGIAFLVTKLLRPIFQIYIDLQAQQMEASDEAV